MAATVTTQILHDGPRTVVILINGTNGSSGGTGGADLSYTVVADPALVDYIDVPRKVRATGFVIDQVDWDINAEATMSVQLQWDGAPPVNALYSVARKTDKFQAFGGLYAPSTVTAPTGKIGIITTGAPATNATWSIVLRLKKRLYPAV